MKLLIAGSRSIMDFDLSEYVSAETEMIISGGAKGIDAIAQKYALEHNIPINVVYPQYELYGRAAPIRRNEQMVKMTDEVLVIWDGVSRGTEFTIECAKRMNKKITVVIVANG